MLGSGKNSAPAPLVRVAAMLGCTSLFRSKVRTSESGSFEELVDLSSCLDLDLLEASYCEL